MIDNWLDQIADLIGKNMWLAPVLALAAGILTSFTPCSISNIPLIIGYVGGTNEKNTKKAFLYSLTFALGTAITFVTLGIVATSAGKLIPEVSLLSSIFKKKMVITFVLCIFAVATITGYVFNFVL